MLNPCVCGMYDMRSQVVECSEDNENFDIRFDFKYNMVSDSFIIGGNSQTYGTFAYKDLPIKLNDLPFDATKGYEFLILDSKNALCFTTYELGVVDECRFECVIDDIKMSRGECVGDSIYLWLSFVNRNGSLEGFTVQGNGRTYGHFAYGQDRYKIGPIKQDCEHTHEFIVKDANIQGCQDQLVYNEPLCCGCNLSELGVEEICDGGKLVAFDLGFEYINTPSDQFVLIINGVNKGKFNYADLPIKITNITGLTEKIEIKIFDSKSEACRLLMNYTFDCNVTGPCVFDGLNFKESLCREDSTFFVVLKFVPINPGLNGFGIKVNGKWFDTLPYHQTNVYEIGPFKGDCETKYSFVVQDLTKPDCRKEFAFDKVICCKGTCEIASPTLAYGQCIDGKYAVTLNFKHENNTLKFKVKINNEIRGPFNYADLPIKLEGLKGGVSYEVLVVDGENEACRFTFLIPAVECVSAVNDLTSSTIKAVFRNDKLEISSTGLSDATNIRVYNTQGLMIAENKYNQEFLMIGCSDWPLGVYYVQFTSSDQIKTLGVLKLE
jgi:hypothetical protein